MKTKRSAPHITRQGFTLIELLVVITIIAVLASLTISQATKMMENGRKLQIQAVIRDLKVAIAGYQIDYNRYPVSASLLSSSSGGADIQELLTDENSGVVDALTAIQASSGSSGGSSGAVNLNPRGTKYLDVLPAKNGLFGLVNAQPPYKLVDLWGQPYRIILDTNGDKQVANPDIANSDPKISQSQTGPAPPKLPTEIAVYSLGKDKTKQTKDDVVSWSSR